MPNFIQGFSNGLNTVKDVTTREAISKYGEEIPIDVITQCVFEYGREVAEKKIKADPTLDLVQYIRIRPCKNYNRCTCKKRECGTMEY